MVNVALYQVIEGGIPTLIAHFGEFELSDISLECDESSVRVFFGEEFSYEIFLNDKKLLVGVAKQIREALLSYKTFDIIEVLGFIVLSNSFKLLGVNGNEKSSDLTSFVSKNLI